MNKLERANETDDKKTPGNEEGDRAKAKSPAELRNTTAPRKAHDQPDDPKSRPRDVEKDYAGAARKNH